jgi:hypothetical protein
MKPEPPSVQFMSKEAFIRNKIQSLLARFSVMKKAFASSCIAMCRKSGTA